MPDELLAFLDEFDFFTFSFKFLEDWKWPIADAIVNEFDFEQPSKGLKIIGYESGSIIVNQYNLGKVVVLIVLSNLLLLGLYFALKKRYHQNEKFLKVSQFIGKFFIFSVYLRFVIEAFFFVLVNSLSEIMENAGDIQEGFSFAVAIVTTLV